jgi:1-deoxy-D-xylulose-5-phosphate synthase
MAAGLCKQGMRPAVAVYSTFLQRAYDMIHHDVALPGLPVVFAVDRAGLVGEDGETHQGLYDLAFLSAIPGLKVLAPACGEELRAMLSWALSQKEGPVAIRYPRGCAGKVTRRPLDDAAAPENSDGRLPPLQLLHPGDDLTILTHGSMVPVCLEAAEMLAASGISADVWQAKLLTGGDWEAVLASAERTGSLLVAEEVAPSGSVGQRILAAAPNKRPRRFLHCHAGDSFVPQGTVAEQRRNLGLNAEGLFAAVTKALLP